MTSQMLVMLKFSMKCVTSQSERSFGRESTRVVKMSTVTTNKTINMLKINSNYQMYEQLILMKQKKMQLL